MLVHSYATEISLLHIGWLTKPSLSKHTNGGDPWRLAKKCSLKILSISSLRSAGSRCWSSNFIMISRLNWSYLVNTAITGTRKIVSFRSPIHKVVLGRTILIRTDIAKVLQIQQWPVIGHRDAIPEKKILMSAQLQIPKGTNRIACNLISKFFSCDFRRTNSCTIFSSPSAPASKPRESWKT